MTHICAGNLTIIGSDNGLSPGRCQAIIWTNAGILLTGPLGTNFSEILTEILTFLSKKIRLKMLSVKWRPFCLGLNVLIKWFPVDKQISGLILGLHPANERWRYFAPSQWETLLQSKAVSHWLGANLESALNWVWLTLRKTNGDGVHFLIRKPKQKAHQGD